MLAEMTSSEFGEWMAFFALEPWGFEEENRRVGVLASTVANMSGRVLRDGTRIKPDDFVPRERPKADPIEMAKRIFGYSPPKGKG
jgi:hypothetical protein